MPARMKQRCVLAGKQTKQFHMGLYLRWGKGAVGRKKKEKEREREGTCYPIIYE